MESFYSPENENQLYASSSEFCEGRDNNYGEKMVDKEIKVPINEQNLFVVSKEKHKLCAARGLEQWWPTESELVHFFHNKKNIC